MTKINNNQYICGKTFYHRVSFTCFQAVNENDYSQLHISAIDYYNCSGKEAVVNSSHIFYDYTKMVG